MQRVEIKRTIITPKKAQELLNRNTRNRSMRKSRLRGCVEAMEGGSWVFCGDTVTIDWNGDLLDGQHRLFACLVSGISFDTIMVTGLDPVVSQYTDTGAERSKPDALKVAGEINCSTLAAAVVLVNNYNKQKLRTRPLYSNSEVLDLVSDHPTLKDSVAWARTKNTRILRASIVAALHYLFSRSGFSEADEFFEKVINGYNLTPGDPAGVLRGKLEANRYATASLSKLNMFCVTIKAWNAYRSGRIIKNLRFRDNDEKIPLIK